MENKIKSERAIAHLSQEQLAEILQVHQNTVAKWEKDIDSCPTGKLKIMSERFGCTVSYLIGLTETRC